MKPAIYLSAAIVAAISIGVSAMQQKIYWGDDVPANWNGTWADDLRIPPEKTKFTRTTDSLQSIEFLTALKG